MTDPARITPPWDDATVTALNNYQRAGRMHPFTCRVNSRHVLTATPTGWICEHDGYRQDWAHTFMTEPALGRPWTEHDFASATTPEPPVSVWWHTIDPVAAANIVLPVDGITGPLNEQGEPCPWPWEPQQLIGAPMGQYHCPNCGAMCVAGMPHLDYRADDVP